MAYASDKLNPPQQFDFSEISDSDLFEAVLKAPDGAWIEAAVRELVTVRLFDESDIESERDRYLALCEEREAREASWWDGLALVAREAE